jgi:predicted MFS family arabinose efflux permease
VDVAMNAHGVAVERVLGYPVMNSLHGAWSVGAMVGSGTAGLAAGAGWSVLLHFGCLAAVLSATSAVVTIGLLPAETDRRRTHRDGPADPASPTTAEQRRRRSRLTRAVVLLGLMGSGCLLAEGAVAGWSTIFLTEQRGTSPALASVGYLSFSVLMAAGRMVGDRLCRRWGPAAIVRSGALLAAGSLAIAVAVPAVPLTIGAFGLCGAGLSVLVPAVFSAVGRESTRHDRSGANAGSAVAHFTTLSYLGVLGGPVLVGAVAQRAGLTAALALPAALLALVALSARLTAAAPPRWAGTPTS